MARSVRFSAAIDTNHREATMRDNTPRHHSDTIRQAAYSENTRIAYEKGWRCFATYCDGRGLCPYEAESEDIVEFFATLAGQSSDPPRRGMSLGTLRLYRSALNRRYAERGKMSPAAATVVGDALRGLARLKDHVPRRVKALRDYHIVAMLDECGDTRFGCRDAAMLALGFAAALRRSELCGLKVADIDFIERDRMTVTIRRSKTDQRGEGQSVAVPNGKAIRPISRLQEWLQTAGITEGYIFQTFRRGGKPSGRSLSHSEVPRVIKRYAAKIGLDPRSYSGHSLRAGVVTSAAAHHARLDKIMEVTRHRNPTTELKYIREATVFVDHAGAGFL
ncbi:MAG: tyrosine-type recombinase/integrase [Gemmatimonadetes bacterium]|nr:tyrosine-type recombinase/integrase [Gemmatimonadota bacterium]